MLRSCNSQSNLMSSKVLPVLFSLAIYFLPYDAVRFLPSNYRPLILLPIALVALLCVRDMVHVVLNRCVGFLVAFSCYAVIISFIDFYLFESVGNYLDCLATIWIGLLVFSVSYCCFQVIRESLDLHEYVSWFCNLMPITFILPMLIGIIQAACVFGFLPYSISAFIASLFGTQQVGRIALASSEASWASMQMLFSMPLIYISYINTKKKLPLIELFVFGVLFVVNSSAQGFATLAVGLVVFVLLLSWVRGNILILFKKVVPIMLIIFALVFGLNVIVQLFPVPEYVRVRFSNLVSIDSLIHQDGSSFIRICYPLLSLRMWIDSPLIGLGGGSFSGLFSNYIANLFPWAIDGRFPEVTGNYVGSFEPSACCLYTRILGEFGLIGFLLYVLFIGACLNGVKKFICLPKKQLYSIVLWAGIIISIPVQFQSYCYVPVLLGLAFIAAAGSGKESNQSECEESIA